MIHGRAEERLLLPDRAMTAQETAAMFEARGLTSPDKHDLSIAVLGNQSASLKSASMRKRAGSRSSLAKPICRQPGRS